MLLFYQSNKTGIFIVTKFLKKLKINGRRKGVILWNIK